MPDESTTPNLVEIMRRRFEALNKHDIDAVMSFFAPNAVLDVGSLGLHEVGANAIRAFTEDWWGSYEEYENAPEEIVQVGEGIVLVRTTLAGRLPGSSETLRLHGGYLYEFQNGLIVRWAIYRNLDEARAAADRLAKDRE